MLKIYIPVICGIASVFWHTLTREPLPWYLLVSACVQVAVLVLVLRATWYDLNSSPKRKGLNASTKGNTDKQAELCTFALLVSPLAYLPLCYYHSPWFFLFSICLLSYLLFRVLSSRHQKGHETKR